MRGIFLITNYEIRVMRYLSAFVILSGAKDLVAQTQIMRYEL